jgi:hypothetical protein
VRDHDGAGDKLVQCRQILFSQSGEHESDAREIARGPAKTRYEIRCDRVTASYENNRNGLRCSFCCSRGNKVGGDDDPTDVRSDPSLKPVAGILIFRPTIFDCNAAALAKAGLDQPLPEGGLQ